MQTQIVEDYYTARTAHLLRQFDRVVRRVRHVLAVHFGEAQTESIIQEARREYEALIPRLPYIGGWKNPLTFNLVASGWFLAFYRVLKARGISVKEIGELVQKTYEAWLDSFPRLALKLLGWWYSTPLYLSQLKRRAEQSQKRAYPGDWVYSAYEGKTKGPEWDVEYPEYGEDFDWAVDYTECGICKFYQAEGAAELMPYLCRLDYALAERLGLGLARSMALGERGLYCNFRFTRSKLPVPSVLGRIGLGLGALIGLLMARVLLRPVQRRS